ncbi:hypothetical protein ENBRE01_2539 [Enteropsectra breve]|nr:hypothetical protein ENBRE01_2539 [Enteropsectra breve]
MSMSFAQKHFRFKLVDIILTALFTQLSLRTISALREFYFILAFMFVQLNILDIAAIKMNKMHGNVSKILIYVCSRSFLLIVVFKMLGSVKYSTFINMLWTILDLSRLLYLYGTQNQLTRVIYYNLYPFVYAFCTLLEVLSIKDGSSYVKFPFINIYRLCSVGFIYSALMSLMQLINQKYWHAGRRLHSITKIK